MSVLDPGDPLYRRTIERFETEPIAWLTTVGADGQPASSPIWFVFEATDETFLIWSRPNTRKLRNIAANPLVSFHLEGNGRGGDIITLEGRAELLDAPSYEQVPEAVAKYAVRREAMGYSPDGFAETYSETIRVTPTRMRAW